MKRIYFLFILIASLPAHSAFSQQVQQQTPVAIVGNTISGKNVPLNVGQKVKIWLKTWPGSVKATVAGATDSTISFYEGEYLAVIRKADLKKIKIRSKGAHKVLGAGLLVAGTYTLITVNGLVADPEVRVIGNILSINAIVGGILLMEGKKMDLEKSWILRMPAGTPKNLN